MKRLAVVVQRCHAQALGGSEALAWHYAQLLHGRYSVEVLTSCALDYVTWDNALPAGAETVDGITVRRFTTAFPRGRAFTALHRRLLADHARDGGLQTWREALAEEFIRVQGPWCPGLLDHLAAHADDYAAVIACTYLYPTSYVALDLVPRAVTLAGFAPKFTFGHARNASTIELYTYARTYVGFGITRDF